jgi:hypothetical protein
MWTEDLCFSLMSRPHVVYAPQISDHEPIGHFQFQPLAQQGEDIRLLKIHPKSRSGPDNKAIRCTLQSFSTATSP